MPRTRPAALVLIPILLAVTACDPSPGSTDAVSNSASPTSAAPVAALTRAAARADAKRLDAAVQTAYTAALGSQHDRSKLAAALASPELDRITFFSRYLQEAKGTSTPRTITYRPERVYSPLADSGPQAVITAGTGRTFAEVPTATHAQLLVRSAPNQPWRLAGSMGITLDRMPEPAPPETSAPSAADRAWADALVDKVADYLDTGKASGFAVGWTLEQVQQKTKIDSTLVRGTTHTTVWSKGAADLQVPGWPVTVLRTAQGRIAYAVLQRRTDIRRADGSLLPLQPIFQRLFRDRSRRATRSLYEVIEVLITRTGSEKPQVIVAEAADVFGPALR